jgi:peptide/nickel transport system permease protein
MSEVGDTALAPAVSEPAGLPDRLAGELWRRTLSYRSAQIGLALLGLLLAVAFVGPLVAPHSESAIVGAPLTPPSAAHPMGTDELGRDSLSRFLRGGDTLIILAFVSTGLGYVLGTTIGLAAGYRGGLVDSGLMRIVDIVLAFPSIILVLILVAGLGADLSLLVGGVALTHLPRVARVVRGATQETAVRGFVERAEARGEGLAWIMLREILPNISTPILADFGIRFSTSVILVASLSFLGFGLQPPAADWALMINESRDAITIQPSTVLYPVIALGLLTIAVNMIADGIARAAGRSLDRRHVST